MRIKNSRLVGDLPSNLKGGSRLRGRLAKVLGNAEPWPRLRRLPDFNSRSVAPAIAARAEIGRYKYTSGMIGL